MVAYDLNINKIKKEKPAKKRQLLFCFKRGMSELFDYLNRLNFNY